MGLAEAVLVTVNEMERVAGDVKECIGDSVLRSFARELRAAVKAAESNMVSAETTYPWVPVVPADMQHRQMIDKAREDLRRQKALAEQEDRLEERMVHLADSEDLVPIPAGMPVGAKTSVGRKVYELRVDGVLHPVEKSPVIP